MFEGSSLMMSLIIAILIINLITLVLVIVSINKNKSGSIPRDQNAPKQTKSSAQSGVVFCRNCGNQYDSTITACPNCKTPR